MGAEVAIYVLPVSDIAINDGVDKVDGSAMTVRVGVAHRPNIRREGGDYCESIAI
jgi:hypothetical protein